MFLNKIKTNIISTLLLMAGLVLTWPYMVSIAQSLEENFYPVIENQKVSGVNRVGNTVLFTIEFDKSRDCRSAGISWAAVKGNRLYSITVYNPSGVPTSGKTHVNKGQVILGPFSTTLPDVAQDANYLIANIFYDCHAVYETRQEFARVLLK